MFFLCSAMRYTLAPSYSFFAAPCAICTILCSSLPIVLDAVALNGYTCSAQRCVLACETPLPLPFTTLFFVIARALGVVDLVFCKGVGRTALYML